jgi:hypothetical protein
MTRSQRLWHERIFTWLPLPLGFAVLYAMFSRHSHAQHLLEHAARPAVLTQAFAVQRSTP